MDPKLKEELIEWGMDWDDIYGRFMGKEEMIAKYVFRYPEDANYAELKRAVAEGDADTGFKAAHNLKGVCVNLGLKALTDPVSEITELLRGGEFEREEAERLMGIIEERQEALLGIIGAHMLSK